MKASYFVLMDAVCVTRSAFNSLELSTQIR
jgi:hypothetical protein